MLSAKTFFFLIIIIHEYKTGLEAENIQQRTPGTAKVGYLALNIVSLNATHIIIQVVLKSSPTLRPDANGRATFHIGPVAQAARRQPIAACFPAAKPQRVAQDRGLSSQRGSDPPLPPHPPLDCCVFRRHHLFQHS